MKRYSQSELKQFAISCTNKVRQQFKNGGFSKVPFVHCMVDNFLPEELAEQCLSEFPSLDDDCWEFETDSDIEIKQRTKWQSEFDIPDGIVDSIRVLNSSQMLRVMSEVFEIPKLIPDPYYTGGGLNACTSGGLLGVHVDGNYHDATALNRRLNALVYLNPNWQPGWGGELGLYDEKGEVCVKKIEPLFNRLVIFDTHDKSYHGLPDPMNHPAGEARRSILLYYYTKEARPSSQTVVEPPHSALWKARGFLDKKGNKTRKTFVP